MAQRRSLVTALSAMDDANTAISRLKRASSGAATTIRICSSRRPALMGARVQRCEVLLCVVRDQLRSAHVALSNILKQADDDNDDKVGASTADTVNARWDTPPESWWSLHHDELAGDARQVLALCETVEKRWECSRGDYMEAIQRMESDVVGIAEKWRCIMEKHAHWIAVVGLVEKSLPAVCVVVGQ